ncbi:MAG: hypothetical protein ACNI3A_15985 [Desulfovibrio sp.]|uniref:hypothetical protein n=1 Tax=Desulfovibrio sp. 7SRBS1 TaxID=3378064 RepID=UPI003B3CE371
MTALTQTLYKRWIYPVDPAFIILRFALKTVLAGMCALLAAILWPRLAEVWCVAGALALMLARGGNTITQRRLFMLATGLCAAVFVPIATMAGHSPVGAGVFAFVLAFCAYYSATLGQNVGKAAIWVLILSTIAVSTPASLDQGLIRSLSLLVGGCCSFLIYFLIWPINPESILRSAGRVGLSDVADYVQPALDVVRGIPGAREICDPSHARASNSVGGYRRNLEAMGYSDSQIRPGGDWATRLYIIQIRLFKAILALSQHADCLSEAVSAEISEQARLAGKEAAKAINTLARNAVNGGPWPDTSRYDLIVDSLERQLVNPVRSGGDLSLLSTQSVVGAFNALYALKTLGREMKRLSDHEGGE